MYWFKHSKQTYLIYTLLFAFTACRPDVESNSGTPEYFNIKDFFTTTAAKFTGKHARVLKTLVYNQRIETKEVKVNNWKGELELFINSDINKPAWRNSYSIKNGKDLLVYKAKTPELKTREIAIKRSGGKIKWILIYNHTRNILYASTEKLSYYPDSVYVIEKTQSIRLLGKKTYKIKGIIN